MTSGVFSIALAGPPQGSATSLHTGGAADFLVGPENPLAPWAIQSLLKPVRGEQSSAPRFNPLFLCGPPGTGKSHLARGLAREFSLCFGSSAVVCLTGHQFAQDYAQAVELQRVAACREELRSSRLLVVDEIEPLAAKAAAQQELIATLDAVIDGGGQVVITSRHAPRDLRSLSPQLRSRLTAGLELPLALPGPTARLALLQRLAAARGVDLPDDAAQVLAEGVPGPAPELLGVLMSLEVACRSQGIPLDAAAARSYLSDRQDRTAVGLRSIALATARYFNLKLDDLKSSSRERPIVTARCVAMCLARRLTGKSLQQIGKYFGGRDHSTVLHGCRRAEELSLCDPALRQAMTELRTRLSP